MVGLDRCRALISKGKYSDAEQAARGLLAEAQSNFGENGSPVAKVLDVLVEALWREGKGAQAEVRVLAERALFIKESRLGHDHPDLGASLRNLARLDLAVGEYKGALAMLERAAQIQGNSPEAGQLELARTLNDLANVLAEMGQLGRARSLYERALSIQEGHLGPADADLAGTLNNLGGTLWELGEAADARVQYERAIAIWEGSLGREHPRLSQGLNNLAVLLEASGDYMAARPLYERVLAIQKSSLGERHPSVAQVMNNLGLLFENSGDYVGAKALYEQALSIYEATAGTDHPDTAWNLTNLANVLALIGDYKAATALFKRALRIQEASLGPSHELLAETLNSLGSLLQERGMQREAKPLFERGLLIREAALGPEHWYVAQSLNNLGRALMLQDQEVEAESVLQRALSIRERQLGLEHPDVAVSLSSLAELRERRADWKGVVALLERAISIREKALGPLHPHLAANLFRLGEVLLLAGEVERALEAGLRAERIAREHLRLTTRSLPERLALQYAQTRTTSMDLLLSIIATAEPPRPEWVLKVWDSLVRSRAVILEEMVQRHWVLSQGKGSEAESLQQELMAVSGRLANLIRRDYEHEAPLRYGRLVEEARAEKERLEEKLADIARASGIKGFGAQEGLAHVVTSLPSRSALVAFALFEDAGGLGGRIGDPGKRSPDQAQTPEARTASKEPHSNDRGPGLEHNRGTEGVPSYVALIIPPGHTNPVVVPLGSANRIETLVEGWRRQVSLAPRATRAVRQRADVSYREAGESLRRVIWDPLVKHVGDAALLFVVPAGVLEVVSLSTLPMANGRYLVETGPTIHYLPAERDLLRNNWSRAFGKGFLIFGAPNFDSRSGPEGGGDGASTAASRGSDSSTGGRPRGASGKPCNASSLQPFDPIDGALLEVEELAGEWERRAAKSTKWEGDVLIVTGRRASEGSFKQRAPGRRIVHLATHGFFAGSSCGTRLWGSGSLPNQREWAENPYVFSGLALAGANRWRQVHPRGEGDDGLLTAEEIAPLDLSGVEWVVLSGCETGLGFPLGSEGLLGLKRSFLIAGARSLIVSLWRVKDESTREWMRDLYQGRFDGLTTTESVRAASLRMIERRTGDGIPAHPSVWGAFMGIGDWR